MLIIPAVGLGLMLLGAGLAVGGVIALVQPKKVDPSDPSGKKRIPDWPVVIGLLLGGLVAFMIGKFVVGMVM